MIDLRERRRQLLNLTITEIILILLFLVLLIAADLIQKNKELIKQNEQLTLQNEAYKSLDVDAAQLVQFRKFEEGNVFWACWVVISFIMSLVLGVWVNLRPAESA